MSEQKGKLIQLAHGGGGLLQNELIDFITKHIKIKKVNDGVGVDAMDDGATIPLPNYDSEIVVTADGHTVDPLFFAGGDIAKLSVCGTVNDLIMMGATPLAITSVIIIEEGTTFDELGKIVASFNENAAQAKVAIIGGDTKVMPKGTLKGIVMATNGIGIKTKHRKILDSNCQPGSKIIVTGTIGDHGAALMAKREGIDLDTALSSDVTALTPLLEVIAKVPGILAMKDPTRGGLASALNEWAVKSQVSIWVDEGQIKVKKEVRSVCEILGLDPMEITNEGKAIICVKSDEADNCLKLIQETPIGKDAVILGEVKAEKPGRVFMKTQVGGTRIIEMPMGEPIPRVC